MKIRFGYLGHELGDVLQDVRARLAGGHVLLGVVLRDGSQHLDEKGRREGGEREVEGIWVSSGV